MNLDEQDIRNATRYGSTKLWPKAERYEIRTRRDVPCVVPVGRGSLYLPGAKLPEIVDGLRALGGNAPEAKILAFTHAFGLLGFDRLPGKEDRYEGDPIEWFQAHAKNVRAAYALWHALRRGTAGAADLQEFVHPEIAEGRKITELIYPEPREDPDFWKHRIETIIRGNTGGIRQEFRFNEKGRPEFQFKWSALVELVYWHLVTVFQGGERPRRCANPRCGAVFIPAHGLQRYCPRQAWWGYVAFKKGEESPCAIADRKRRFLKRKTRPSTRRQSSLIFPGKSRHAVKLH